MALDTASEVLVTGIALVSLGIAALFKSLLNPSWKVLGALKVLLITVTTTLRVSDRATKAGITVLARRVWNATTKLLPLSALNTLTPPMRCIFDRALSADWIAVALMDLIRPVVWFPNVRFICPAVLGFNVIDINCVGGFPRTRIS